MSEWKLILSEDDVLNLKIILGICKREFIRDTKAGREPLFNELMLLRCLHILQEEGWIFGDLGKKEKKQ